MKKFFTQIIIALVLVSFLSTANAENINASIIGQYKGDLLIDLNNVLNEGGEHTEELIIPVSEAFVFLSDGGNGTISLHLKDFGLEGLLDPTDINVPNVSVTRDIVGIYDLTTEEAVRLILSEDITADVTVSGNVTNNVLKAKIDVDWLQEYEGETIIVPIPVTFVGVKEEGQSIVDNKENSARIYSMKNEVIVSEYNGLVNVFNLSGVNVYNEKVNGSTRFTLEEGLYIIKANDKVEKVFIK